MEEEIKRVVFSMNSISSPDSDGFGVGLQKTCWNIIKEDLVASSQHFVVYGEMPDNFSPIHAYLVPKTKNANKVELFKPIVLANFHYKIITKVFA